MSNVITQTSYEFAPAPYTPDATLLNELRLTLSHSRAEATEANHAAGWAHFLAWCHANNATPLPATPEILCCYLQQSTATLKLSTVLLGLRAIGAQHERSGFSNPAKDILVLTFVAGLRRRAANEGQATRKMAALRTDTLRRVVAALPDNLIGIRDRALLLVGFAGAFRRSEITSLNVSDLTFTDEGCRILVRRSKTDQMGNGATAAIPYGLTQTCPVRALQRYLTIAAITSGPIFWPIDRHGNISATRLTKQSVRRIVMRSVATIGLDPVAYGSHSLRRGFATSAAQAGAGEREIMRHGRWTSIATARGYMDDGTLFSQSHPLVSIGL